MICETEVWLKAKKNPRTEIDKKLYEQNNMIRLERLLKSL